MLCLRIRLCRIKNRIEQVETMQRTGFLALTPLASSYPARPPYIHPERTIWRLEAMGRWLVDWLSNLAYKSRHLPKMDFGSSCRALEICSRDLGETIVRTRSAVDIRARPSSARFRCHKKMSLAFHLALFFRTLGSIKPQQISPRLFPQTVPSCLP